MHVTASFYVIEQPKRHRRRHIHFWELAVLVHWLWRPHMPEQVFTHPQGDTHLYQLAPLKTDGTPGTTSTPVVYSVDNPAVCSVTPNNAVALDLQCTVVYLTPGTANITATGTNEAGASFSTTFQCVVTAVVPNLTSSFSVTEVS
jgi:hypothetical protein